MNKIFKTIIAVSIIFFGTVMLDSCKKDWLKPRPLSIYSPENTFTDLVGFKAALNGCAKNLRDEWYGDGAPIISETIFSEVAVEGTDDKTGPAQDLNLLIKPDANLKDRKSVV